MADDHFSRETIERFFRSELSREEARGFVRHLLRRCPRCSELLRAVSQGESHQMLLRGIEELALHDEPDRAPLPPLASVTPFPGLGRSGVEGEVKRRSQQG